MAVVGTQVTLFAVCEPSPIDEEIILSIHVDKDEAEAIMYGNEYILALDMQVNTMVRCDG